MSAGLKKILSHSVFVAALCLASACGDDSETGIPQAPPPPGSGETTDLNTGGLNDPRFPTLLEKAVEISLTDNTTYAGLKDLATTIFTPIVETFVALEVDRGRDASPNGAILVGFEDSEGFWGALVNTFPLASQRTSETLDMIFSDSELSIRMVSGINGDDMVTPSIYYRLRKSGEKQCQKVTATCTKTTCKRYNYYYGYCEETQQETVSCDTLPASQRPTIPSDSQLASDCRTYMNLGNSNVKKLGTFNAKYSQWVK